MKNFWKNHKIGIIAGGVILIVLIILTIAAIKIFFPNDNANLYGNRLDGIENVEITKEIKDKLIEEFTKDDRVESAEVDVRGRIIYVIVYIKTNIQAGDTRSLDNILMNNLSDEIKSYYDIQIMINNKHIAEDDTTYPIIGYKHKSGWEFSWSNN